MNPAPATLSDLIGRTPIVCEGEPGDDELNIVCQDGSRWRLYHDRDFCESVRIESIEGDLSDLVGMPIAIAEEVSSHGRAPDGYEPAPEDSPSDSWTWTFYKFATAKGHVTIRWLGESNGYYSESVDFGRMSDVEVTRAKEPTR